MSPAEQIAKLDDAFLKSVTIDVGETPDENSRANIHAYLVLSHAILEEHIESVFDEYFERAVKCLDGNLVPKASLALVYSVADRASRDDKTPYLKRSVRHEVERLGKPLLAKAIRSNNGLKPANIENLAQAAGVAWGEFDDALSTHLANLQNLGVKRGDAGHLSPFSAQLTEVVHPEQVREWVSNGVSAVAAIESFLLQALPPNEADADTEGNTQASSVTK